MPPSYRGGTEEYAYQLARQYSGARPVHILTTSVRWTGEEHALSVGSSTVERLRAREVMQRPLLVGGAATARLRDTVRRAGVVQLHMPFPLVERRVTGWARAAGVPSVLTYHMDAEFGEHPSAVGARIVTGAYRTVSARPALGKADVVISNSLGYAKASPVLSRYLPKVRVIYQGIDKDRLVPQADAEAAVPPRTPGVARVVFIGRVVAYKGLPNLLRAVDQLLRAGRKVELLLGGKGPQLDELKALAIALRLGDAIRFLGFVPDGAVGRLYASADVVACPSVSLLESTPITLQEAMSFGTPVVGTTLPGTEETVPNDGIRGRLVPPNDVPGLAAALAELIDHGRPGAATPMRDWADTARDYLALFDELEAKRRGSAP